VILVEAVTEVPLKAASLSRTPVTLKRITLALISFAVIVYEPHMRNSEGWNVMEILSFDITNSQRSLAGRGYHLTGE
jgi:hypothetical protein